MGTSCGCGCGGHEESRAGAVLARDGLDRCCCGGAHLSLRAGAAAAGAPLDEVLAALNVPAAVTA